MVKGLKTIMGERKNILEQSWGVIFHQNAWVSKKERNQKKKAEGKQ